MWEHVKTSAQCISCTPLNKTSSFADLFPRLLYSLVLLFADFFLFLISYFSNLTKKLVYEPLASKNDSWCKLAIVPPLQILKEIPSNLLDYLVMLPSTHVCNLARFSIVWNAKTPIRISDFRLGSKQAGARINTENYSPQQQWAYSRQFESEAALKK